jgi:hypothetical protein
VQPTLAADGGPLRLESIMRRVDPPEAVDASEDRSGARRVESAR